MSTVFRVLILGGYGNFGNIIATKLVRIPNVEVIIAGRDHAKAEACARRLGVRAACLDIQEPSLSKSIQELSAHCVVSTAGPFQEQDYSVAQAAIAARAHYVDIADARGFVCGITQLDSLAKANDVLIVSGASSVPALAAGVVDRYQSEFKTLLEIDYGISSSEKIPGLATVAAVLGYCGKPIRQWRDNVWRNDLYGWQELRRHCFNAPLGARWLANCDIPDLELFPTRYPTVQTVRFQAGIGLPITQFGMWALSWIVRAGMLQNVRGFASLLRRLAIALEPFGNGYSGMFVKMSGLGLDGQQHIKNWEIVAQNNHGPNIPCMAIVALIRKLARGGVLVRGAMPCLGLVLLDEYLSELSDLNIQVFG